MQTIKLAFVLTLLVFASVANAEQEPCRNLNEGKCRESNESRCREMNESMLQMMKSTPLDKPRDIERNKELIARVETMLTDNRRQGVDECRSWMDFNRIIVHQ